MKKGKELEEIINENLPKLFKKYFLPKIDEKRLEDKLNEIKPKLDSEIENLLKKYPTEGKKAMSISSRMFFGHIDFWMHKDNPDIKVILFSDRYARFKDIVTVLDAMNEVGVRNLNIAARTEANE